MKTYIFTGRVHPERSAMGFQQPLSAPLKSKDGKDLGNATFWIGVSQVVVMLEVEDDPTDLLTVRNSIEDITRALVDSYGYLTGRGYDVEISVVIDPMHHRSQVFGIDVPELSRPENEWPIKLADLVDLVGGKSLYLRRALADLREAIRAPFDTGFHCYRAVEGIMQSFRGDEDGDDTAPAWLRMREALRIHKSWLVEGIKHYADPQRHGGLVEITGADRVSVMKRAWEVVDRFCVYAHEGSQPLPEDKFQLLQL
ncbi:hypothetical protein MYX82_06670 [Acidobacteria bacterium AH-259-D05]|nr:hypothetical protein [Acidobacteria bacterium AH-259-D05]